MTVFLLNYEHQAEIYRQLNIANLTLLYTFPLGVNNLKHQILPLTEENLSGTKKKILLETYNIANT
jgi:hypothetical protein